MTMNSTDTITMAKTATTLTSRMIHTARLSPLLNTGSPTGSTSLRAAVGTTTSVNGAEQSISSAGAAPGRFQARNGGAGGQTASRRRRAAQ